MEINFGGMCNNLKITFWPNACNARNANMFADYGLRLPYQIAVVFMP